MDTAHFETLECGTSLAEQEFREGPERCALISHEQSATASSGNHNRSIDSLRSIIASDVLSTDGGNGAGPVSTFSSPFEVPEDSDEPVDVSGGRSRRFLELPLVYCDQTASNRAVRSIERYMEDVCLPLYGNTHTNTSITGSQTTAFVSEARQIVAEATNAKITGKASLDVVLFTGNGVTSAVEQLIDCLGLRHAGGGGSEYRPVVFVGPFEHHSNLIPWRESGCEVVMVPECERTSDVDFDALERLLRKPAYGGERVKMGTFTAASNLTGRTCAVDRISALLHRYGVLAFFDYATAAPYVSIDMNPPPCRTYPSAAMLAKDAVFLSPHKMLGGVGTPGILIVKKNLVGQVNAPSRSGGGTVFYVTSTHHRFLSDRIERNEGGTPNIAGIVRTGLAFLFKRGAEEKYRALARDRVVGTAASDVGKEQPIPPSLQEYDFRTHERVSSYLRKHAPNLVLLDAGEERRKNLPIFSFLIRFGRRFLHFNYVCAVLNDVFGIQSRGGCQCAGPYAQRMLGLTETTVEEGMEVPNHRNEQIERALLHFKERAELLRPGVTRLSLPFKGLRAVEEDYVLRALVWISENAWALMCQYRCNHRTGEWRHYGRQGKPLGRSERKWLSHYDFVAAPNERRVEPGNDSDLQSFLDRTLENANRLLAAAKADRRSIMQALKMADAETVLGEGNDQMEELRWYVYPKECAAVLAKEGVPPDSSGPPLGALSPQIRSPRSVDAAGDHAHPVVPESETNVADARACVTTGKASGGRNADRKRKPTLEAGCCLGESAIYEGIVTEPASELLISFRDGDHAGEAPLEEISTGFDDGELSEGCQVFDVNSDEWVPITSFLSSEKKDKVDEDRGGAECGAGGEQGEENVVPEAKNTRKKPTRDSSNWGQGSCVAQNGPRPILVAGSDAVHEESPPRSKKRRQRHLKPPAKMLRLITQAMIQWDMIQEGDRLLLGLSGGKDSLSLLHCLLEFQRKLPVKFELEVCTIDPMTPSFDPSPLIPYVESLGLKYHFVRDDIVSRASTSGKEGRVVSSLCAYCARMKRGNLYSCARRNGCNKLVLAQHLDDCAESFMMSVMHNGFLRTMKANYRINAGDISVIRPMVYCRESLMTEFAKSACLPVINENCPACFEEPKERARVKKMLSREETLYPNYYDNIRHSLIPLMHDDSTAILRCYTEEAVAKSRKQKNKGPPKPSQSKAETKGEGDAVPVVGAMPDSNPTPTVSSALRDASDEDLIKELARRKAEKFRLSGAMKRLGEDDKAGDITNPTGQVFTRSGGNGTIPCSELME